jgi:hypothetical protein
LWWLLHMLGQFILYGDDTAASEPPLR